MGHDLPPSAVIETNLSRVFLAPNRVYKLLRPVRTSFVDFTDRAQRLAATTAEYELNRRISPDVYLGVADIEEHGTITDRMIVMERLSDERRLDRLVDDPAFPHHLRRVARLLASFHAGQPPLTGPVAAPAGVEALQRNWADNFEALQPFAGAIIPPEELIRARELVEAYIAGRKELFAARIDQGWVRDGHGDLRCEHVFCPDDGPRLIDCLAFRDDFRVADVLNDVAFLAMDLHRVAGPEAARSFIANYDTFSHERHPSSLAHHYVAYRASVRAKVAAIACAAATDDVSAADRAAEVLTYHRLTLQHLEAGCPRIILVGGGAGVGKSTVAGGLADRLPYTCLRADEIRKELAGMAQDDHAFSEPGTGIYTPEFTDRVYDEMLRRAETLLHHGESVILDASWGHRHHREAAVALGQRSRTPVVQIHCQVPRAVARERVARRLASMYNPSDATPEVVDHLARNFDPWPDALTVDTGRPVDQTIEHAYCLVMSGADRTPAKSTALRVDEVRMTAETIALFLSRQRVNGLRRVEHR